MRVTIAWRWAKPAAWLAAIALRAMNLFVGLSRWRGMGGAPF
jgi:hypothetical protein